MSARQPFIPQQRPPFKPNPSEASADESFRPNGLLSDSSNTSTETNAPQSARNGFSTSLDTPPLMTGAHKPLNLAGFVKKKSHGTVHTSGKAHQVIDDHSSSSPKPMNQQATRIVAPSPFFPSSSGFAPIAAFRTPSISSSKLQTSTSTDEFGSNQPHIPSEPAQDGSNNSDRYSQARAGHRMRPLSQPSLERIYEIEEETSPDHGIQGPGAGDGQEMIRNSSTAPEGHARYESDGKEKPPPLRRINKRPQRNEDVEDELDYGNPTKRYKPDNLDEEQVLSVSDRIYAPSRFISSIVRILLSATVSSASVRPPGLPYSHFRSRYSRPNCGTPSISTGLYGTGSKRSLYTS